MHSLACHPLTAFGTDEQKQRWLPDMLGGSTVGAYSLSEPQAGSDAAALACKATLSRRPWLCDQRQQSMDHPRRYRRLLQPLRPHRRRLQRISCFLVPKGTEGLSFGKPEEKMGLHAVPTTAAHYDNAAIDADRRIGTEGQGLQIAFSALDSGRLGIAAVAVGIAQAALDDAVTYAQERTTFGRKIIDHQASDSCWPTWPPP